MMIQSLHLSHFRNYTNLSIDFNSGTNILYGDNAQGKTNILESLYVCGTTKSHKGAKDREMIQFGYDESHIRVGVCKNNIPYQIDLHLRKNKAKGIAINQVPIKKASDLFGILNIVFFSPEDLNIIKNGPAERRRFLDLELCQLDKIYLNTLTKYNQILNQRNRLLKDMYDKPELKDTLTVWDQQLVVYGQQIIRRRQSFIEELNTIIFGIHKKISGSKEELVLKYEPSVTASYFGQELSLSLDRDQRFCVTSVGPHRDDFSFLIQNIDIRKYGSQGQQRSAALSLKLSEIELVKKLIHDSPVLLLDDVLSELDNSRQNQLLNSITAAQTIITCTGLDEFIKNRFQIDRIYRVTEGKINEE